MNIINKILLITLLLSFGYFLNSFYVRYVLYASYDKSSQETSAVILEGCKVTTLYVVSIGGGYSGQVYDCAEDEVE